MLINHPTIKNGENIWSSLLNPSRSISSVQRHINHQAKDCTDGYGEEKNERDERRHAFVRYER